MTLKDAQRFFEIDVEFLEREIDDCKNSSRTKEFLGSRIEAESIAIQALIVADSGRPFETRGVGERRTIQERALESLESRKARITYGYDTFKESHMEKVQRQLEVIEYLEKLVKMDEVRE